MMTLSVSLSLANHAQSTQKNNKFAMSLQYLKGKVKDEIDFCKVKMKVFNKLVLSNLMGAAKHV